MGEIARGIKDKIKLAESLINSHEHQKAIDSLLDIIEFFEEVGDFKKRDKFLLKIDDCYKSLALQFREQKDYFEAAETYCSAAFLQKEHDKNEVAHQLFNDAIDCFVCAGKNALSKKAYLEASTLFNSAAKYAKTELQDKLKSSEHYQNAIEALKEEILIHSSEENPLLFCQNRLELGKIYENVEAYQKAIECYEMVAELSVLKEMYSFAAESYQQMSYCYECLGNYDAMVDCLNKAVDYRLLEAEKYKESDLPLEAVQNFIAAANCVSKLRESDELLMNILQSEANCFLTAAKQNAESGQILQAAYYERNAAYCYNQLGKSDLSIDLLLTAAEKLLSIDEFYGAAYNFQDVSLYEEKIGNYIKAANYALKAANSACQSGDFEIATENFKRAAQIYQSIGYHDKVNFCNKKLAECYVKFAELNENSNKSHIAGFLLIKAASFYSKSDAPEITLSCYEKAIEFYENAIKIAIKDDEKLLASYSACCATLVCLIMKQPTRAMSILNNVRDISSNTYYKLSDSLIKAYKTKNLHEYNEIHEKFQKIIQNSPEIKNMFDLTRNYL